MSKILTADYDTLVYDIKVDLAAIQATIPDPLNAGVFCGSSPHWFEANSRFPFYYNRFAGLSPDDGSTVGAPIFKDVLAFTMRLVVGTLATGYLGAREDTLDKLIYTTINVFRRRLYLNDPVSGTGIRYLSPRTAARISAVPSGDTGFQFVPNGELFLGCDFTMSVSLSVQLGRLS